MAHGASRASMRGEARACLPGRRRRCELALAGARRADGLAELATQRAGEAIDLAAVDACWRRSIIPIRRICWSAAPASRISARPKGATGCTGSGRRREADRFHAHVSDGRGGRQAGRRARSACSPNGSTRATARSWSRRAALTMPAFAQDGGEEPEIAGIYLIGDDGTPLRLGFALGNEFSDHVTERENYLWLAHSKLRQAALGPELLLGALPQRCARRQPHPARGRSAVGEAVPRPARPTCRHSIANLEHHHFKYALFRRPGDVHVHFFGTATAASATGSKRKRATCSRSRPPPSPAAAQPAGARAGVRRPCRSRPL